MDSEELYDSLEEEINQKCTAPKKEKESVASNEISGVQEYDISAVVPLYSGETHKDSIKLPERKGKRKNGSKIPIRCQQSKSCSKIKSGIIHGKCIKSSVDLSEFREKNSYVNMFHAKNAKNKEKIENDTARSQFGDSTSRSNLSDVSDVTEFSDAKSSFSDTTSFYFDIIKKMEANQLVDEPNATKNRKSISIASSDFNLKSVSEFSVVNSTKSKSSRTKLDNVLIMPKLGSLGPDLVSTQKKLTRLQKQKSYGQKASDQNRIKMLEIRVLKELKTEIKNSKS